MNAVNYNGPAFPVNETRFPDGELNQESEYGMTLRNYLAAKAMQADMINSLHEDDFAFTAARAYKMANAMLEARAK